MGWEEDGRCWSKGVELQLDEMRSLGDLIYTIYLLILYCMEFPQKVKHRTFELLGIYPKDTKILI